MNPRALLLCTLLSLISFFSLVRMAAGEAKSSAPQASATAQPDIAVLKKIAEGGGVQAQSLLGLDYMTGNGVAQDFKEAVRWYLAASAKGSADAQFGLGYLYEQGKGVPRDYLQAMTNYTAAARQGHAIAENNLGSMYEDGRGVARNMNEAARYYRASAEHGNPVGQSNLASLCFLGN